MSGLRLALAADEAIGLRALRLVDRSDHELAAVASPAHDRAGIRAAAEREGVAWFDNCELRSAAGASRLREARVDVLVNAHSMVRVAGEVLEALTLGAWNLHPGPLPELAGMNAPSWAIVHGHAEHGVTLHAMTADYDDGPIAYEDRFPIPEEATGLTLSVLCATRGLVLIGLLLDQLAGDPAGVPARRQPGPHHRFHGRGQPGAGRVDWSERATDIAAHVRAADFRPFPSPWRWPVADIGGQTRALVEVEIGPPVGGARPGTVCRDGSLAVAAADRWIIVAEHAPPERVAAR